ncbi:MAG: hypothetical protein HN995_13670 [Candidatus Marinimicrobia bacterium]|jgi:hypothetical protein|nr:hypothetical protein [Candidatus Neomarinimicrobiota bacterium]MBT3679345.1 hypothetical protein [Candidatus Neomarinimicrobiota bacterium]MBT5235432.1 hypothetical protein [Candidatus Neomarinimicrobiota bacterium]MBT6217876.1 hypothetical protein [Candidatus Neomarinimicrobiota bacterium]MBT6555515.1 hypothetical protein [Candidatus Neomarinimicrobiota bacterium]
MSLVIYHCAICGENLEGDSKLDPCGISIFSNIDKENESDMQEAMFFSHYECFRNSLEPGVREYLNFEDQSQQIQEPIGE